MKSPFPGLDPYLQRIWRDVHHMLIATARELLAPKLPADLRMHIEERVVFETDTPDGFPAVREYIPDVGVIEYPSPSVGGTESTALHDGKGGPMVAEPLTLRFPPQPVSEGYLEVRDASTGSQVITTLEFISPTNKVAGPARDAFLRKQADMQAGRVSLVEVDLVRGGGWVLAAPEYSVKQEHQTEFRVCISHGWTPGIATYYPITLRQRLPTVPIPLRKADQPVHLELQTLLDLCYERGRYDTLLDYHREPDPPLATEDSAWAETVLRQAGKR